jgi:hypothetical protein
LLKLLRKLAALLLFGTPLLIAALGPGSDIAYASTPSAPANTVSYYVNGADGVPADDNAKGQTLGCDAAKTGESGLVVLDFAGQYTQNGTNGTKIWTGTFLSDTDIESATEGFAQGFANCASPSQGVWLGVGTNSSFDVSQALGQDWAGVANTVNSWVQGAGLGYYVMVAGADDIENLSGWASASVAEGWASGFLAGADGNSYFDYGSATCGEVLRPGPGMNGPCDNGWMQSDIYQVAWGNGAAFPLPEIYNVQGANALQWEQIGLYGYYNEPTTSIPFDQGSVTEDEACQQKPGTAQSDPTCHQDPNDPSAILTNTPSAGWTQLYQDLTCTNTQSPPPSCYVEQSSLPYSTDFSWY